MFLDFTYPSAPRVSRTRTVAPRSARGTLATGSAASSRTRAQALRALPSKALGRACLGPAPPDARGACGEANRPVRRRPDPPSREAIFKAPSALTTPCGRLQAGRTGLRGSPRGGGLGPRGARPRAGRPPPRRIVCPRERCYDSDLDRGDRRRLQTGGGAGRSFARRNPLATDEIEATMAVAAAAGARALATLDVRRAVTTTRSAGIPDPGPHERWHPWPALPNRSRSGSANGASS